ncbi:PREDICTED: uncharacterized protein LOC100638691 isoform X1 [Amphimedon queenslandica]|uniref:Uncharacterized protein n=2 Tax=Amphimedon queenslandica TaxID=400682 RepID=A0AAN0IGY0_AMPQE|nr:PREDICTED: uncharacterized protein LOC100638691 isoform X1 [Amphimedon queenslandica]|eukprot:XP_003388956.1 PREDICTED: uncharacterized protein LOC100638691 isoform X1 [Amphimedon queenslandica]
MATTDSLISLEYINLSDVLRHLKHYMYRIRRENGFDLSGPEKPWGEFTAAKGGSYYFSYYQDQLLESMLDSYSKHREGKVFDNICELLASRPTLLGRIRGPLDLLEHQEVEDNVSNESTRLILTIAQILIQENGVFLKSLKPLTSPAASLESSKEHLVIDSVINKAIVKGANDYHVEKRERNSTPSTDGTDNNARKPKPKNSKTCCSCGREKPSKAKPVLPRMISSRSIADSTKSDSVSSRQRRTAMGPALVYVPPSRGVDSNQTSPRSVLAAADNNEGVPAK